MMNNLNCQPLLGYSDTRRIVLHSLHARYKLEVQSQFVLADYHYAILLYYYMLWYCV